MDVSVVIPTYNRSEIIDQTMSSIMHQSLQAAEIIVVDDGSTDDTPTTLAAYGDRIRVIRVPNSGELFARNTGLKAASGDLVAFCDSDDVWEPNYLSEMTSLWKAEPTLHAAYANFRILRDGKVSDNSKFDDAPEGFWRALRVLEGNRGIFDASYVENLIEFQPFFPSTMTVHRKRFLKFGGWDEGVSRTVGCDFATALKLAANPPVGVILHPLVRIRKHASNFSADTEKMNLGDAAVMEYVLASNSLMEPLKEKFEASIARRREAALHAAFDRRDFDAVRITFSMLPPKAPSTRAYVKRLISILPTRIANVTASLVSR